MGIFRKVFMNVVTYPGEYGQMNNYNAIPAIPVDIGYKASKETRGARASGVYSMAVGNPGVILGMGLTTAALLGMFRKSFMGDRVGAQKFMQYRIMAQFMTVAVLVAGVTFFGMTYESHEEAEARMDAERLAQRQ